MPCTSTRIRIRGPRLAALLVLAAGGGPLAFSSLPAAELREFRVRDFGAAPDGSGDAGPAIRAAIAAAAAAAPAEVVLEAGSYRVLPENQGEACVPVLRAAELVIRGAGKATRIAVGDPASGCFGFGLCRQVTPRPAATCASTSCLNAVVYRPVMRPGGRWSSSPALAGGAPFPGAAAAVRAMWRAGQDLRTAYRETARGRLAVEGV